MTAAQYRTAIARQGGSAATGILSAVGAAACGRRFCTDLAGCRCRAQIESSDNASATAQISSMRQTMGDDLEGFPETALVGVILCVIGLCAGATLLGWAIAH